MRSNTHIRLKTGAHGRATHEAKSCSKDQNRNSKWHLSADNLHSKMVVTLHSLDDLTMSDSAMSH